MTYESGELAGVAFANPIVVIPEESYERRIMSDPPASLDVDTTTTEPSG